MDLCQEHQKPFDEDGTCAECKRLSLARILHERALQSIEALNDEQQSLVIECGMRMRELACYYGPYFRFALSLTGCEIACGALILPKQGECERTDILLPGGQSVTDLDKIFIPGSKH